MTYSDCWTLSVLHVNVVVLTRAWLPSSRPTMLLNILLGPIVAVGSRPCMLGNCHFNQRWSGRCTGVVIPYCINHPGWISWFIVKTSKTLATYYLITRFYFGFFFRVFAHGSYLESCLWIQHWLYCRWSQWLVMIVGQFTPGTGLYFIHHEVGSATKIIYLLIYTNSCSSWSNFGHKTCFVLQKLSPMYLNLICGLAIISSSIEITSFALANFHVFLRVFVRGPYNRNAVRSLLQV
jgi:hypothetical protein